MAMIAPERQLEEALVTKLRDLKYEYRPDIRDRATLEANFRVKFEALNRVTLMPGGMAIPQLLSMSGVTWMRLIAKSATSRRLKRKWSI